MTEQEFWKELSKIKLWFYDTWAGEIRTRALIPGEEKACFLCPMTAVAYKVLGYYIQEADYRIAASALDLPEYFADVLAWSSDHHEKPELKNEEHDWDPMIRQKLLEICKL